MRLLNCIAGQEETDEHRSRNKPDAKEKGGSRSKADFVLLGHDCPLGRYPAPVVPIGLLGRELVAIYPRGAVPGIEPIEKFRTYVRYPRALQRRLTHFDYLTERLFARSENDVFSYPIANESQFFKKVLSPSR